MTALIFQTGRRQKTIPASLWGMLALWQAGLTAQCGILHRPWQKLFGCMDMLNRSSHKQRERERERERTNKSITTTQTPKQQNQL